jgi:hypothetical protein
MVSDMSQFLSKYSFVRSPPHISTFVNCNTNFIEQYPSWEADCRSICHEMFHLCIPTGRRRGRRSSPSRVNNFLFSTLSRPALGLTQAPSQWVPGTLPPGVERPGREADHSPPTNAEVKNGRATIAFTHTSTWYSVQLIKLTDNFTSAS